MVPTWSAEVPTVSSAFFSYLGCVALTWSAPFHYAVHMTSPKGLWEAIADLPINVAMLGRLRTVRPSSQH